MQLLDVAVGAFKQQLHHLTSTRFETEIQQFRKGHCRALIPIGFIRLEDGCEGWLCRGTLQDQLKIKGGGFACGIGNLEFR